MKGETLRRLVDKYAFWPESGDYPLPDPAIRWHLGDDPGSGLIVGCLSRRAPGNRKVVMALYGTCGNCAYSLDVFSKIADDTSHDVAVVEYVGYGFDGKQQSEAPSIHAIEDRIRRCISDLLHKYSEVRVVAYSIGTMMISYAMTGFLSKLAGVALITPFASLEAVANHLSDVRQMHMHFPELHADYLPLRKWMRAARQRRYRPTVLIAGRDDVVTADQGRILAAGIGNARVIEFPDADHTSIIQDLTWAHLFPDLASDKKSG